MTSIKRRKTDRLKAISIKPARWAAYATAGAATTLATQSAEADFFYSGVLNTSLSAPGSGSVNQNFTLGDANDFFNLRHRHTSSGGAIANFAITGLASARFVGTASVSGPGYVTKLGSGVSLAGQNFITTPPGLMVSQDSYSNVFGNFNTAGIGFVGFKFDNGSGTQYGWARIQQNGPNPSGGNTAFSFTLIDYAYGSPTELLTTGQTVSAVPEPGSLGLLAFGGAGLLAWRKRRALTKQS